MEGGGGKKTGGPESRRNAACRPTPGAGPAAVGLAAIFNYRGHSYRNMQPTRRCRTAAAVGAVLAVAAVLFARLTLLVGAAGIGAWLLARQIRFVRAATRADAALTVDQSVAPDRVATGHPVQASATATLSRPARVDVGVAIGLPAGVRRRASGARAATVSAGETTAVATDEVDAPVAGAFTFDPATVTFADDAGLFTQTVRRGSTPTLEVVPRAPRNVHVGRGGERFTATYGEHGSNRAGSGLDPVELREYVAGDAARRIDWNATARLGHPHVWTFEAATDRTTALVVDHRGSMAAGPAGETKLDYVRQVALGFVDSAAELGDPAGLYAIGDEGLTARLPPEATAARYADLRSGLYALDATGRARRTAPGDRSRSPSDARTAAVTLADETGPFAETLRPYFDAAPAVADPVGDDPLLRTVRTHLARTRGTLWTVLFTDDAAPGEVREAVTVARRGDDHVLVFLTPSVLFEEESRADPARAYDRYRAFEEFRRDLDRLDRVTALEVAPGDRLHAVLETRRRRDGVA